jgi:hypothetical protein
VRDIDRYGRVMLAISVLWLLLAMSDAVSPWGVLAPQSAPAPSKALTFAMWPAAAAR